MNNPFLLWSLQRLPGIFINLAVIYKSPFTVFMLECVLGESFMIGGVKGVEANIPQSGSKKIPTESESIPIAVIPACFWR
jgi:hypothetical protein